MKLRHRHILFACPKLTSHHPATPSIDDMDKGFNGVPLNLIFSPYAKPKVYGTKQRRIVEHRILFPIFAGKIRNEMNLTENRLIIIYNGLPNLFEKKISGRVILTFPPPSFKEQFTGLRDLNSKLFLTVPIHGKREPVLKFFSPIFSVSPGSTVQVSSTLPTS